MSGGSSQYVPLSRCIAATSASSRLYLLEPPPPAAPPRPVNARCARRGRSPGLSLSSVWIASFTWIAEQHVQEAPDWRMFGDTCASCHVSALGPQMLSYADRVTLPPSLVVTPRARGEQCRSPHLLFSSMASVGCESELHLLEEVVRAGDDPLTEAPELSPQLGRNLAPSLLQHRQCGHGLPWQQPHIL